MGFLKSALNIYGGIAKTGINLTYNATESAVKMGVGATTKLLGNTVSVEEDATGLLGFSLNTTKKGTVVFGGLMGAGSLMDLGNDVQSSWNGTMDNKQYGNSPNPSDYLDPTYTQVNQNSNSILNAGGGDGDLVLALNRRKGNIL